MSSCVKCSGKIIKYNFNGVEFEICDTCNAVIITKINFDKLCKFFNADCKSNDLFNSTPVKSKEQAYICNHCGKKAEKVLYNGLLIDRCKNCEILIFDNGELSKYFSSFSHEPIEIMNNAKFIKTYCCEQENKKDLSKMETVAKTYDSSTLKIQTKEREFSANTIDGWFMVFVSLFLIIIDIICFFTPWTQLVSLFLTVLILFSIKGFKILAPQEALVLILFGEYKGSIKKPGFYWVNPFCASYNGTLGGTISLKTRTLENAKQKINDKLGNPIEIGIMVTWEIKDTAMAVFNVENYESFLSAQCDGALRNIARQYPYDSPDDSNIETLRNDSIEISEQLKTEIQNIVAVAGIKIISARITHLSYSTEIAAAMLQRQQANAIVEARKSIVDGAIGIVELALNKLEQNKNIVFDDKTKANLVNNLLVVLCANKESTPIIRNDLR